MADSQSIQAQTIRSGSQCTCAINETSSSNTSLLRIGPRLHSLTGLVGDVRVTGNKVGSTVDISRARPSTDIVSLPQWPSLKHLKHRARSM